MKEVKNALRAYCRGKNRLEKEFEIRVSYLISEGKTGKRALKEAKDWLARAERMLLDELTMNVEEVVGIA